MATTDAKLMTAEELLNMPEDGYRYELIRGVLKKMAPAGHTHGKRGNRVNHNLSTHVYSNGLGEVYLAETGFILETDPDHVRAPDVAFVRQERVEEAGDGDGYFPGAPDLAVEVISPSDRYSDVAEKTQEWLNAGTLIVVVVNSRDRTVNVHTPDAVITLNESDTLDGGDVVPGWHLPIADIFE